MRVVVFAGPSLPPAARPPLADFDWHPPARQGDVYRVVLSNPDVIAILDGYFEVTPTVWHKELLWAMAQGVHVYGAASIGALRAAELDAFGMKGVGRIYDMYRSGMLQDDDEVAVLHGPAELGYPVLNEPMVNIRATLEQAVARAVIDVDISEMLICAAKGLFYKERTYGRLFEAGAASGVDPEVLNRLVVFVADERVDQKRLDALTMLQAIRDLLGTNFQPFRPSFQFARTAAWRAAVTAPSPNFK